MRARKVLDCPKLPGGGWEQLYCRAPTNQQVKAYLGPDKSPARILRERASKELFKVLQDRPEAQGEQLHLNKQDFTVSSEWQPLARIVLQWGPTNRPAIQRRSGCSGME